MPPLLDPLARRAKQAIAAEITALFNDRGKGEAPVARRPDGLFGPASVVWRVHGDVTSMTVGGISSLLLQMLHPAVLAGVWDHSNFRADMLGRLRRTARFVATTSYSGRAEAEAAIDRVGRIHARVTGTLPDGTPYRATDPHLLAWVHVTETLSFLAGWIRYAEPNMPAADRDRYFAEMAQVAGRMGADPVPRSQIEALRIVDTFRPELRVDHRTREICDIVLNARPNRRAPKPLHAITRQAAIDLLPDWARAMHGLPAPVLTRPLVRAGTMGIARTIRWAFG
jgi:uncharacterized protein (DUF2236 family)